MTSANIRDVLTSFSPALDFFAICSGDGRIKIWDTVKSQVQTEFADIGTADSDDLIGGTKGGHHSVDYTCMKWLSLNKKKKRKLGSSLLILGTGSGDVLALDVSAGQLKWRVSDCHPGGVTSVSFPTHGSCIYTAGADGMICELDSLTGNSLRKFKASTKAISSMSVSPDGKTLATAAAQLKVFDCSDHRKIQKFSGHPAAVRCMIFSEDGKYILSSAVAERYVAAWRIDGSKKKLASVVLAMDHPAVFLDSRCIATGDNDDEGLCVLAISEIGVCYFWSGQNIDELRDCKPTKVSISTSDRIFKNKGVVPSVFAAKLQAVAKPCCGHLFAAYGSLIKPSFEKILVQPGEDIKLNSSPDGILLPLSQIKKGKKGSTALTQITALDRANAEDALLPMSKILYVVDGQSAVKSGKSNDVVEFNDVTHCMEERLISLGILSSDSDLSPNSQFDNILLKGINLEANMSQKKGLADARKKKRKQHFSLEQELASLWEKMRCRNISKEDRSKWISEAIKKMKGKIPEIAGSHVSSRVLQTCAKYCSQEERNAVFEELQPQFLNLACNTYAVHLITKMLDNATKKQLADFISTLRGHVASLLRHMVGSVVVEHAYNLGNAAQKQALLVELYSTELQLFKDLGTLKERRLVDIISKLQLQKASVSRHMTSVVQPILEKGIVDHSIIHRLLMEYFTIADQSSAAEVIQQLSGPLLVRMIHTKDGSRIGMLCVKHGNAKERKKLVKGLKDHVSKIAHDRFGNMLLVCILSYVDDTKLTSKIVIRELKAVLKEIIMDKDGRRPLLQLLHPNCPRYLSPDDLASLDLSIPSLCTKVEMSSELTEQKKDSEMLQADEDKIDSEELTANKNPSSSEIPLLGEGGKKDPVLRRRELLINSGLAESLIDICGEIAGELLVSRFGKEVLYEVATGGADGILLNDLDEKLHTLYEAVATLAAKPKSEGSEEEHLLENFHSSRTIRKLVLDCPNFASVLWENALKGKCELWAQGHSCKVVTAFLESSDSAVRELAKEELKPLIDAGTLKLPDTKHPVETD